MDKKSTSSSKPPSDGDSSGGADQQIKRDSMILGADGDGAVITPQYISDMREKEIEREPLQFLQNQ